MTTKRKWHTEIVAWANGAEVESSFTDIDNWSDDPAPDWNNDAYKFRIKQTPTEPEYLYVYEQYVGEDIKCVSPVLSTEKTLSSHHKLIGKIKMETNHD